MPLFFLRIAFLSVNSNRSCAAYVDYDGSQSLLNATCENKFAGPSKNAKKISIVDTPCRDTVPFATIDHQ